MQVNAAYQNISFSIDDVDRSEQFFWISINNQEEPFNVRTNGIKGGRGVFENLYTV